MRVNVSTWPKKLNSLMFGKALIDLSRAWMQAALTEEKNHLNETELRGTLCSCRSLIGPNGR
jgi:hypothetical protein